MLKRIDKAHWQRYFDRVSRALAGKAAEIELVSPRLGVQTEARRRSLVGLSYDPKADLFAVICEGLEHNIAHPGEVHVDQELDALRSLQVVDKAGERHVVTLTEPLRLPPPAR